MSRPLFQKRHYTFLTEAVRDADTKTYMGLLTKLIDRLSYDNPRFDIDKFFHACSLERITIDRGSMMTNTLVKRKVVKEVR